MSDKKTKGAAAKKAADEQAAKATQAKTDKTAAEPVSTPEAKKQPEPVEAAEVESVQQEEAADKTVAVAEPAQAPTAEEQLVAVEVHTTLERRCRAGYVFGREPLRIEGKALATLDYQALEADPYLHVEYITDTGAA